MAGVNGLSDYDFGQVIKIEHDEASSAKKVIQRNTFITSEFDYVAITLPTATSEVYTYKTGGVSGTTVGVITLTFTDATKTQLSSVAKTSS